MPRGRVARPWFRKSTQTWYVTLSGQQVLLGRSKREAYAEFARLTVGRGSHPASRITVRSLADLWLEDCGRRLKSPTLQTYRSRIGSFVAVCGTLEVSRLKPYHLSQWVAKQRWGQSTTHSGLTIVKLMVAWGEREGYINSNPIAKVRKPGMVRRRPITLAEAEVVTAACPAHIRVALELLLVTGLRPGELCSLDGRRIDLAGRRAIVTGKAGQRTIPLGEAAMEITTRLVKVHPAGPLLVGHGQRGTLTVDTFGAAVKRARRRIAPDGSLDHVTPHCWRGLFATEALRCGVDAAIVSLLLGHRDASMVLRHYASPDHAMLLDAMQRATSGRTAGTTRGKPPGRAR